MTFSTEPMHACIEPVEKLVVTFKTMCWNGRIVALGNSGQDIDSLSVHKTINIESVCETDIMCKSKEIGSVYEEEDDDDVGSLCSSTSDFMDLDTDEDDAGIYIDLTRDENKCTGNQDDELLPQLQEECEGETNVPIAEYASEESVLTLPNPPAFCTNVDIDRCIGRLLVTEYNLRKKVGILDRKSILDLQAKSCALEEFSSVSNEVVVGSECSDVERHIPLSDSCVDNVRKTDVPKVLGHMLSFQASSSSINTGSQAPFSPRLGKVRCILRAGNRLTSIMQAMYYYLCTGDLLIFKCSGTDCSDMQNVKSMVNQWRTCSHKL